jgi:DNA-binding HxlR family transcriptional regulator
LVRALQANALVTRVRNPEVGKGPRHNPEPWWLYRLTPAGEALRDQLCGLAA